MSTRPRSSEIASPGCWKSPACAQISSSRHTTCPCRVYTACLRSAGITGVRMPLCASAGPAPRGRHKPLVLAERVATELTGLRDGVIQGARLLYDGLPIHLLGKGALLTAACAHLARPCIAGARELLGRLAEAAGVDATALRRSEPALMQRLDCLVASVQDEVAASCGYWEELCAALAMQRASRPGRGMGGWWL